MSKNNNMQTYCVHCKEKTGNKNCKGKITANDRKMMLSECSKCKNKKINFCKQQTEGKRSSRYFYQ